MQPGDNRRPVTAAQTRPKSKSYSRPRGTVRAGASERSVKYRLSGERGPGGGPLIALARQDKERAEQDAFNRLKAELTHAFAAPEETYQPLTVAEVIAQNRA